MENASKALIIAGAILIAIILISVGIYIIKSIKPVVNAGNEAGGDLSKSMHNSTFTKYVGEQKGSNVRSLISNVITNNSKSTGKITVKDGTNTYATTGYLSEYQATINTNDSFNVSITGYDPDDGYVSEITITKN